MALVHKELRYVTEAVKHLSVIASDTQDKISKLDYQSELDELSIHTENLLEMRERIAVSKCEAMKIDMFN